MSARYIKVIIIIIISCPVWQEHFANLLWLKKEIKSCILFSAQYRSKSFVKKQKITYSSSSLTSSSNNTLLAQKLNNMCTEEVDLMHDDRDDTAPHRCRCKTTTPHCQTFCVQGTIITNPCRLLSRHNLHREHFNIIPNKKYDDTLSRPSPCYKFTKTFHLQTTT